MIEYLLLLSHFLKIVQKKLDLKSAEVPGFEPAS